MAPWSIFSNAILVRPAVYKYQLLALLAVTLLFNVAERQTVSVVLQDIKVEFALTDTQLGMLSGFGFAFFYAVMGLPIARWADRGNRVTIISATTALWSIAVALCGIAGSFVHLLLVRVGVAIGEAGCVPPAVSLITDYFSRAELPRATAIYAMGGALASVVGVFLAGWVNEIYGWRMTFMVLSVPGALLAALAWFVLTEPRRMSASERASYVPSMQTAAPPAAQATLSEVCTALWRNVSFRRLLWCWSLLYFFGYGIGQWLPAFFIRSYGLTTGELATSLTVSYLSGGLLGTWLSGEWACRFAPNDQPRQLKAMTLAIATGGLLYLSIWLSSNPYVAFGLLALATAAVFTTNGPGVAAALSVVPERMRAVSFALTLLVANLIGMGLGPLATGAISDFLNPWVAEESLRYSLLILTPGFFLAAWCAWRASQTIAQDLAAVDTSDVGASVPDPRRASAESMISLKNSAR